MPADNGYSRAMPLRWLPAFTAKSKPVVHAPQTESQAALSFLVWLREQLERLGRAHQALLMVADGGFDTIDLWKGLPDGVILMVRSAKNRVLYHLPAPDAHASRRYGERALPPQQLWRDGFSRDRGGH